MKRREAFEAWKRAWGATTTARAGAAAGLAALREVCGRLAGIGAASEAPLVDVAVWFRRAWCEPGILLLEAGGGCTQSSTSSAAGADDPVGEELAELWEETLGGDAAIRPVNGPAGVGTWAGIWAELSQVRAVAAEGIDAQKRLYGEMEPLSWEAAGSDRATRIGWLGVLGVPEFWALTAADSWKHFEALEVEGYDDAEERELRVRASQGCVESATRLFQLLWRKSVLVAGSEDSAMNVWVKIVRNPALWPKAPRFFWTIFRYAGRDIHHAPAIPLPPGLPGLIVRDKPVLAMAIQKAWGRLTGRDQSSLQLHYVEGLTIEEIRQQWDTELAPQVPSVATLSRWRRRARLRFYEFLKEQGVPVNEEFLEVLLKKVEKKARRAKASQAGQVQDQNKVEDNDPEEE